MDGGHKQENRDLSNLRLIEKVSDKIDQIRFDQLVQVILTLKKLDAMSQEYFFTFERGPTLAFYCTYFFEATVIRTRIMGAEGEDADQWITTTTMSNCQALCNI